MPLWDRALAVLDETQRELRHGRGAVFPSPTGLTQDTHYMARLMQKLKIDAVTHGFRGSFGRSDLFERCWIIMQQWADYVSSQTRILSETSLAAAVFLPH